MGRYRVPRELHLRIQDFSSGRAYLFGPLVSPWTVRRRLSDAASTVDVPRVRYVQLRWLAPAVRKELWALAERRPWAYTQEPSQTASGQ